MTVTFASSLNNRNKNRSPLRNAMGVLMFFLDTDLEFGEHGGIRKAKEVYDGFSLDHEGRNIPNAP